MFGLETIKTLNRQSQRKAEKIASLAKTKGGSEKSGRYCPKCGETFFSHNDDGSCVKD